MGNKEIKNEKGKNEEVAEEAAVTETKKFVAQRSLSRRLFGCHLGQRKMVFVKRF